MADAPVILHKRSYGEIKLSFVVEEVICRAFKVVVVAVSSLHKSPSSASSWERSCC